MFSNNFEKFLKDYSYDLIYLKDTESTMEEAKKYLRFQDSKLIILADQQSRGRGRRGTKWISEPGNIYCTIVFPTSIPLKDFFLFSILTSVSIKISLMKFGIDKIMFKWPNDIFYKKNKLGGMILESYKLKKKNFVIIGLGMNFTSSPVVQNYKTTYIKKIIEIENKEIFLKIFFENFFYILNNLGENKKYIISVFKRSLLYLGQTIKIKKNKEEKLIGIFKGINSDGSLILDKNGKLTSIYSGSIEI